MEFFLYEILARVVAIYLCVDCSRTIWHGFVEGKIRCFDNDVINWLLMDGAQMTAHRNAAPVQFWIQIVLQATFLASSVVVAIFGWWHPDS